MTEFVRLRTQVLVVMILGINVGLLVSTLLRRVSRVFNTLVSILFDFVADTYVGVCLERTICLPFLLLALIITAIVFPNNMAVLASLRISWV